ncbi:hypothetical protein CONCODRAFT_72291 [Conidiobolus coronatus NRRL 28638]|uniref:Uncharacterized protein n=1 Tax=Conidiobolus coronatus (strain ATCC 28846 / CBS 209.66 / NRRL 28638) TaxID=796925 RepID=A0A137NZV7_CONC2|nr:hypothetical protein CONCODRAFT_72291 [Conidiobolus coronatus NRRL 28638]|eukprot:KXN68360.1 hypothetical protein CONCODRAFT_72291 [Conidiobolus coronatus NRRL 28638]
MSKSPKVYLTTKELSNTLIQKFKKLNIKNSENPDISGLITTEFNLEPIPDEMRTYRKGFTARSMDKEEEFDQIINYGYGVYNDDKAIEFCYTLKISLTPGHIRTV